jgi:hypothetical protein
MAKTVPVGQLAYGVREVESGGVKGDRYKAVNSIGATGAYQVMRQYIGPWTKEAFGRAYTEREFVSSPSIQDRLAQYRLGRDQKKYGSWEAAAAVWFSGQPDPNSRASDGGNNVRQYVDKVGRAMAGGKTVGGPAIDQGLTDSLTDTLTDGTKGALKGDPSGSLLDAALGGITRPFADVAAGMLSIGKFAEFLLRLALPSTWVRIVCGLLGIALLTFGLVVLGLEAKGT